MGCILSLCSTSTKKNNEWSRPIMNINKGNYYTFSDSSDSSDSSDTSKYLYCSDSGYDYYTS